MKGTASVHVDGERGHRIHGARQLDSDTIVITTAALAARTTTIRQREGLTVEWTEPTDEEMWQIARLLSRVGERMQLVEVTRPVSGTGVPTLRHSYRAGRWACCVSSIGPVCQHRTIP